MKRVAIFFPLFFVIIFAGNSSPQDKDYTKESGYYNFGDLSSFDNEDEVTEVFVEEQLLRMVGKMTKKEDPELSTLLNGLKLVKVNSFSVNQKNEKSIRDKFNFFEKDLIAKQWTKMVKTKSKTELVNIYIKTDSKDNIQGLVVTVFEKNGEAALINVVGTIDLESISKLSDKFDIPALDELKSSKDEKKK